MQFGPEIEQVLTRLHHDAKRDWRAMAANLPSAAWAVVQGRNIFDAVTPAMMKNASIPVDPEEGHFLYLTARAIGAKTIVEFGTSFGVSSIYMAAAVRDNGGGKVIGTEIEAEKRDQALANIAECGLSDYVEILLGDATETLREAPEGVDMVLLDGWKNLYIPVIETLTPKLRPGAVVLADNIFTFKRSLRPFVQYMQSPENGFQSVTLPLSDGLEYAVFNNNFSSRALDGDDGNCRK